MDSSESDSESASKEPEKSVKFTLLHLRKNRIAQGRVSIINDLEKENEI